MVEIDYQIGMCINFLNGIRKVVDVTPTIIYYTNWYSGIQKWGDGIEGSFGRDYVPSTPTTVITCPDEVSLCTTPTCDFALS